MYTLKDMLRSTRRLQGKHGSAALMFVSLAPPQRKCWRGDQETQSQSSPIQLINSAETVFSGREEMKNEISQEAERLEAFCIAAYV